MSLIKSLEWRYATKKMNGKAVAEATVEKILQAIQLAPTSLGLQPFTVIVVKDQELKKQIQAVSFQQPQITAGSHLLVFAAWTSITETQVDQYMADIAAARNVTTESLEGFKTMIMGSVGAKTNEEQFQWSARQAYIAFGTGIAAAAEEKVDATPMEGFNGRALDEILGLTAKNLRAVTLLPLGYRDEANDAMATMAKVRRNKEKLFIRA